MSPVATSCSVIIVPCSSRSFIDPDRGADYSEPSNPIEIGEYIDPDRGAVLEVNPLEVLSIGAFIDPDSLPVTNSQETVEVGEYVDPDRD